MKKITLALLVILLGYGLSVFLKKEKQISYEELRNTHQEFVKNHPFSKTLQLSKDERKAQGIPPNKYFEQEYLLEMNPKTGRAETEKLYALQEKLNTENSERAVPGESDNMWIERGPNNVPGRTRAIMFDPNDNTHNRVFAGSVSGGLWVNDNIESVSSSWQKVAIPENLSISSITYDENNPQNMFIGTGESHTSGSINGNGIWRSTDGGTTWEHVMGGSTGATFFNGNATLTVNSGSVAGEYHGLKPSFGPQTTATITADLVVVNDGTANPTEGCSALVNAAEVSGKIALIERGSCLFTNKVMNAQNAGAVAVVIINNFVGNPMVMGGTNGSITIPSFQISHDDGVTLMNAMASETLHADFNFDTDNDPSGTLVPGTFHINDIRTRINAGVTEIYAAASDASYTGGVIMGSESFGLYKSTDNGTTWTRLTLPLTTAGNPYMPNDIEIGADNTLWVSTMKSVSYSDGGGAVLSSSDGNTFNLEYTVPGVPDRTEIAVSSTDPDKLYVINENTSFKVAIFSTTDRFATTSNLPKPVDAGGSIPADDFTRGQAYYDLMIAVNPNDDDIVYVGGVDSFRSTDGGNNWSQMSRWTTGWGQPSNIPLVHADQHELIFHPTNSDKGIMATDGGVFFAHSFAGAIGNNTSISSRGNNYNTTQFYKAGIGQNTTNTIMLAGAQDNGTFLQINATDGINSFNEIYGGDGTYCFIDKDGQYMIGSTPKNNFRKFTITGNFIGNLIHEDNGAFVNPAELDDNLDILYTNASASNNSRISRLKNITGGTVNKTYLSDAILLGDPTTLKVSPYSTSSTTLFVGTGRGNVFKVTHADTSAQWETITGPEFFGSVSAINFGDNENKIMVTYHNYGVKSIWYTTDGGATWESKEGDFPDIPVKDIMMNPLDEEEVILATNLGVWMTANFSDANPNWVRAQNGMQNVKVTSFDLRTADYTVLAATYGRGLFTGKFSGLASVADNNFSEALVVYPTLSNGTINIKANAVFSDTAIHIFDTQGKLVYKTTLDLGEQKSTLNLNLDRGIYIMKLSNTGLTTAKRIIIN